MVNLAYYYGGRAMYYRLDPTYILVLIGVVLSLLASAYVKSSFNKYARTRVMSGMTGAQVAERILNQAGIYDVRIVPIAGNLTDHYNPKTKEVGLSETVYHATSISAVSVAAHECGHVIQHANGYVPITIRSALVPVANFGSSISWFLILAGLIFGIEPLIPIGIILFSAAVLFQLVTLPVEFNASHRALAIIRDSGIVTDTELRGSRRVLRAAALTYVAAAAAAILQLLRLLLLTRRND